MAILLALSSALVFGVVDYCGGRASRFHQSELVTFVGQSVSLVLIVVATIVMGTAAPGILMLVWGGLGGMAGAVGWPVCTTRSPMGQ